MPFYKDHWCQPIITMHHAASEEIDELDKFEIKRKFKAPVQIKDIFYDIILPKLRDDLEDWDNMSDDTYYFDESSRQFDDNEKRLKKQGDYNDLEKVAQESFENCRAACESISGCVQFRFGKGICSTSTAVRFGKQPSVGEDPKPKSGWMLERIKKFAKDHDNCGAVKYPELKKD